MENIIDKLINNIVYFSLVIKEKCILCMNYHTAIGLYEFEKFDKSMEFTLLKQEEIRLLSKDLSPLELEKQEDKFRTDIDKITKTRESYNFIYTFSKEMLELEKDKVIPLDLDEYYVKAIKRYYPMFIENKSDEDEKIWDYLYNAHLDDKIDVLKDFVAKREELDIRCSDNDILNKNEEILDVIKALKQSEPFTLLDENGVLDIEGAIVRFKDEIAKIDDDIKEVEERVSNLLPSDGLMS